jgi:hypothetical protein
MFDRVMVMRGHRSGPMSCLPVGLVAIVWVVIGVAAPHWWWNRRVRPVTHRRLELTARLRPRRRLCVSTRKATLAVTKSMSGSLRST